MRLPRALASAEALGAWVVPEVLEVRSTHEHVIVDVWSRPEEFTGWVEGPGWMASLAGVRETLLRGDHRALYLGWLVGVSAYEVREDQEEPPVPPGLASLPPALASMVEFFALDEHLVAAAAEASASEIADPTALATYIAGLPAAEKNTLLTQVASGQERQVAAALARAFAHQRRSTQPAPPRRTVADLRNRAVVHREEARRRQEREAAAARRRQEAAAAAAKEARLNALAGHQPAAWRDVERLVASKNQKAYDQAVALLQDLRDLAARDGTGNHFASRLADIRATHSAKRTFIERLVTAHLR